MDILDLKNVYVGRYKISGKETVFYNKTLMRYADLKDSNREIYVGEINLTSLVSFKDSISTKKEELKKSDIIRLYDNDRSRIISLDELSIGDIYRVTAVQNSEIQNNQSQRLLSEDVYTPFKGTLIKQGALLINEEGFFKDLEHSIIVKRTHYPKEGELIVIENDQLILTPPSGSRTEKLQPFTTMIPMEGEMDSKRKILEEYRRYMI